VTSKALGLEVFLLDSHGTPPHLNPGNPGVRIIAAGPSSCHMTLAQPNLVLSNVRDQRRRAVGAPLAEPSLWKPLAHLASGVKTSADRCIA